MDDADEGSLVTAALRELFEETGILLCDSSNAGGIFSKPHAFSNSNVARTYQKNVIDSAGAFPDVYSREGEVAAKSSLVDFCQFLTPVFEKRRYLAHFYVTCIEEDVEVRISLDESSSFLWVSPAEAIKRNAKGMLDMLPPQFYILNLLSRFDSTASLEKAVPVHAWPIQPHPVEMNKKQLVLAYPGDEAYPPPQHGAVGSRHRLRCTLPMGSGGYEYIKNIPDEQARGSAPANVSLSKL